MPLSALTERSYTQADIPENFFLSTNLRDRMVKDLQDGVLDGVTGIAADGRVMVSIGALGTAGGNLTVVMPGKATVATNRLSRVMYENPEYWVQNNFSAAVRVLNSTNAESAAETLRAFRKVESQIASSTACSAPVASPSGGRGASRGTDISKQGRAPSSRQRAPSRWPRRRWLRVP